MTLHAHNIMTLYGEGAVTLGMQIFGFFMSDQMVTLVLLP